MAEVQSLTSFLSLEEGKSYQGKKMGSWHSFSTRNKSSLSVVIVAYCVVMPGMNTHRSLMLQFWDEGITSFTLTYIFQLRCL